MGFKITTYLNEMATQINDLDLESFNKAIGCIDKVINNNGKIIVIGNGGSAAIAAHASVDFTKASGIRSVCFNESSMLTCFTNDYGQDNAFARAIEFYSDPQDLVILISSSGKSKNILNAGESAKRLNLDLITFSGFDADNPLKRMGCVNFWVNSEGYNIVENTHQVWLLSFVDHFAGGSYYKA